MNRTLQVLQRYNPTQLLRTGHDASKQSVFSLGKRLTDALELYPVNLVLTNRTRAHGYNLNRIAQDIYTVNSSGCMGDVNDLPTLVDYNVIDGDSNALLLEAFKEQYTCIDIEMGKLLVVSLSEREMTQSTSFLERLCRDYKDAYTMKACILNTHCYPFLKEVSKDSKDTLSSNMYQIAMAGLVCVHKHPNGSLILTQK